MTTQTADELRELIRQDTKTIVEAEARRLVRIKRAREMGVTAVELAEDTNLSAGRISQIAPKPKKAAAKRGKKKAAAPAAEAAPAPERKPLAGDELPEPFRPGAATRITATLSDLVSDRWAKSQPERATIFVDLVSGAWCSPARRTGRIEWKRGTADELLTQIPEGVERVYLVGAQRPGVTPETRAEYGSEADAVRMWFLRDVPGWRVAGGGHYLADESHPVGRWETGDPSKPRSVEVLRAATWFGEGRYSAADAAHAWWLLRGILVSAFGNDAIPMSTPATTGRDMWRRTIGRTRDGKPKVYPVLSDELRELIQSTSGQGRREIIPGEPGETIPGFVQYDMRFAYAALAWGMPVGEPTMVTGRAWSALTDEDQGAALMKRGRWLITATVPAGWDRVGILPAPTTDVGWCYPRHAGQKFTTWASGGEVELARRHGWRIDVHEGFTFREEKPLNAWRDALTKAYMSAERGEMSGVSPEVQALIRAAMRNMVLMTIGAFAARSHMVSRSAPATPEGEKLLPANRPVREVGGMYLWEEPGERSPWVLRTAHPEWSAEIWARCRVRLLDAPTGERGVRAGALHVPPGTVLGMRTDALYLSADPEWPDDGEPGRYRLKGRLIGERPRPTTDAQLEAMKTEAARG